MGFPASRRRRVGNRQNQFRSICNGFGWFAVPLPTPRNAIRPDLVPGGSSSGSAIAVATGIVSFALGTDTAGSGRVPAALNGIVGLKPSLGLISSTGVVPACRTLDTVSILATNVADAWSVLSCTALHDENDSFAQHGELGELTPLLAKSAGRSTG